jgi:excisionase family DNA binding protein
VNLRVVVPDEIVDEIVERVSERVLASLPDHDSSPPSPYMSVPEAASYLRCSRQRIDDLLSSKRLTRVKEGNRTLVSRVEIEGHLRRELRRR